MSLGLIPKILNTIDVIFLVSKQLRMIDPVVLEVRHIQHVVRPERIRINNAVRDHFVSMMAFKVLLLASGITFAKTFRHALKGQIRAPCPLRLDRACLCVCRQNRIHPLLFLLQRLHVLPVQLKSDDGSRSL